MKRIDLAEQKKILLDILLFFHSFCKEHGINYSISSGTLLGAVRHKGFIPWDDDVDVYMLRADFELFKRLFSEHPHSFYKLHSYATGYADAILKLSDERTILREGVGFAHCIPIGVNIDIFPIDYVSEDVATFERERAAVQRLRNQLATKKNKYSGVRGIHKLTLFFWKTTIFWKNTLAIAEKMDSLSYSYSKKYSNSSAVHELVCDCYWKPAFKKEWFDSFIELDFEGYTISAMVGYDQYLRHLYGDYMQLPPVEQRFSHHYATCYWK